MDKLEILSICKKGIQIPDLNGNKMPVLIPDTVEWDEGVTLTKRSRKVFMMIVESMPEKSYISEISEALKEIDLSSFIVIATNEQELKVSGERFWLYNSTEIKEDKKPDATGNIDLIILAKSILYEKSDVWMNTPLILLKMKKPSDCTDQKDIDLCNKILSKFPKSRYRT